MRKQMTLAASVVQAPMITPHTEKMREVIASIAELTKNDVSVKATTTETMGFVGRGEGLVAYATVLLTR